MSQTLGTHQPTISHMPGETRRLSATNQFTDGGVDAIGAHYDIRISYFAVIKSYLDAVRVLLNANASMAQMNDARRQRRRDKIQKLRAMEMIISGSERSLAFVTQQLAGENSPVVPAPKLHGQRPHAIFAH